MATIKLADFTGEAPRISPRLLPETGAQIAQSVRLEDGQLSPFRKPFPISTLAGAASGHIKTVYKHLTDWLYWDAVVNAVPGPVATDRLYYTGDGAPKMRVGTDIYPLAVPAPTAALTTARVGSLGSIYSTVLYVFTWVTDFGEESEPSPISADLQVSVGNTVTLSVFPSTPTGRNITKQRIYRSQTGTSGGTNLYFIAERTATTGTYTDTFAVNDFSEPLPSLDWNPPPATLTALCSMPNGMMAALDGKDLCFSEPFRPHAWPEKYRLTLDFDGVALAAYGTTLVVGTTGNPYLVGGTHPETMAMEKMQLNMPCLNAQGMIDLGYAIAYPSHDGLVLVQGGSATVPTADLMTRDQWLKLDPANMVCGQFYGRFFGSYTYVDENSLAVNGSIIVDLTGSAPFIIRSQHKADAMFYDVKTGALYMVMGTVVYEFDSKLSTPDVMTFRSKVFVMPAPTSFGAILFETDDLQDQDQITAAAAALAAASAVNAGLFAAPSCFGDINNSLVNTYAVNDDNLQSVPTGPQLAVNIYADGVLVASLWKSGIMQRLPGGRLAREWEAEITGSVDIVQLVMAGTAQELRDVE